MNADDDCGRFRNVDPVLPELDLHSLVLVPLPNHASISCCVHSFSWRPRSVSQWRNWMPTVVCCLARRKALSVTGARRELGPKAPHDVPAGVALDELSLVRVRDAVELGGEPAVVGK